MKNGLISSLIYCVFSSPLAHALSEYIPIQERAQGQALAGAQQLNDSLYSNPAASSFAEVYSVEATYTSTKAFEASVLDTRTSGIGGAFGYFRMKTNEEAEALQGLRLALSTRISEGVSIGVSGKSIWGMGQNGVRSSYKDLDSGMLFSMQPVLLGFTVKNLFGGDEGFEQNREWTVGAQVNYQKSLFLSAAAVSKFREFKPFQYSVGAEYVSGYYFGLKGGFRFQPENNTQWWSAGASILSPRLSLHYAVEFPNQEGQSMEHTLSLLMLM